MRKQVAVRIRKQATLSVYQCIDENRKEIEIPSGSDPKARKYRQVVRRLLRNEMRDLKGVSTAP